MTDIVERLIQLAGHPGRFGYSTDLQLVADAAAEIKRLRALPAATAMSEREEIETAFINLCEALGLQAAPLAYLDATQARNAVLARAPAAGPRTHAERQAMAETIHKARWPADRQMHITPFEDADRNAREYCFRIADAVLACALSRPERA